MTSNPSKSTLKIPSFQPTPITFQPPSLPHSTQHSPLPSSALKPPAQAPSPAQQPSLSSPSPSPNLITLSFPHPPTFAPIQSAQSTQSNSSSTSHPAIPSFKPTFPTSTKSTQNPANPSAFSAIGQSTLSPSQRTPQTSTSPAPFPASTHSKSNLTFQTNLPVFNSTPASTSSTPHGSIPTSTPLTTPSFSHVLKLPQFPATSQLSQNPSIRAQTAPNSVPAAQNLANPQSAAKLDLTAPAPAPNVVRKENSISPRPPDSLNIPTITPAFSIPTLPSIPIISSHKFNSLLNPTSTAPTPTPSPVPAPVSTSSQSPPSPPNPSSTTTSQRLPTRTLSPDTSTSRNSNNQDIFDSARVNTAAPSNQTTQMRQISTLQPFTFKPQQTFIQQADKQENTNNHLVDHLGNNNNNNKNNNNNTGTQHKLNQNYNADQDQSLIESSHDHECFTNNDDRAHGLNQNVDDVSGERKQHRLINPLPINSTPLYDPSRKPPTFTQPNLPQNIPSRHSKQTSHHSTLSSPPRIVDQNDAALYHESISRASTSIQSVQLVDLFTSFNSLIALLPQLNTFAYSKHALHTRSPDSPSPSTPLANDPLLASITKRLEIYSGCVEVLHKLPYLVVFPFLHPFIDDTLAPATTAKQKGDKAHDSLHSSQSTRINQQPPETSQYSATLFAVWSELIQPALKTLLISRQQLIADALYIISQSISITLHPSFPTHPSSESFLPPPTLLTSPHSILPPPPPPSPTPPTPTEPNTLTQQQHKAQNGLQQAPTQDQRKGLQKASKTKTQQVLPLDQTATPASQWLELMHLSKAFVMHGFTPHLRHHASVWAASHASHEETAESPNSAQSSLGTGQTQDNESNESKTSHIGSLLERVYKQSTPPTSSQLPTANTPGKTHQSGLIDSIDSINTIDVQIHAKFHTSRIHAIFWCLFELEQSYSTLLNFILPSSSTSTKMTQYVQQMRRESGGHDQPAQRKHDQAQSATIASLLHKRHQEVYFDIESMVQFHDQQMIGIFESTLTQCSPSSKSKPSPSTKTSVPTKLSSLDIDVHELSRHDVISTLAQLSINNILLNSMIQPVFHEVLISTLLQNPTSFLYRHHYNSRHLQLEEISSSGDSAGQFEQPLTLSKVAAQADIFNHDLGYSKLSHITPDVFLTPPSYNSPHSLPSQTFHYLSEFQSQHSFPFPDSATANTLELTQAQVNVAQFDDYSPQIDQALLLLRFSTISSLHSAHLTSATPLNQYSTSHETAEAVIQAHLDTFTLLPLTISPPSNSTENAVDSSENVPTPLPQLSCQTISMLRNTLHSILSMHSTLLSSLTPSFYKQSDEHARAYSTTTTNTVDSSDHDFLTKPILPPLDTLFLAPFFPHITSLLKQHLPPHLASQNAILADLAFVLSTTFSRLPAPTQTPLLTLIQHTILHSNLNSIQYLNLFGQFSRQSSQYDLANTLLGSTRTPSSPSPSPHMDFVEKYMMYTQYPCFRDVFLILSTQLNQLSDFTNLIEDRLPAFLEHREPTHTTILHALHDQITSLHVTSTFLYNFAIELSKVHIQHELPYLYTSETLTNADMTSRINPLHLISPTLFSLINATNSLAIDAHAITDINVHSKQVDFQHISKWIAANAPALHPIVFIQSLLSLIEFLSTLRTEMQQHIQRIVNIVVEMIVDEDTLVLKNQVIHSAASPLHLFTDSMLITNALSHLQPENCHNSSGLRSNVEGGDPNVSFDIVDLKEHIIRFIEQPQVNFVISSLTKTLTSLYTSSFFGHIRSRFVQVFTGIDMRDHSESTTENNFQTHLSNAAQTVKDLSKLGQNMFTSLVGDILDIHSNGDGGDDDDTNNIFGNFDNYASPTSHRDNSTTTPTLSPNRKQSRINYSNPNDLASFSSLTAHLTPSALNCPFFDPCASLFDTSSTNALSLLAGQDEDEDEARPVLFHHFFSAAHNHGFDREFDDIEGYESMGLKEDLGTTLHTIITTTPVLSLRHQLTIDQTFGKLVTTLCKMLQQWSSCADIVFVKMCFSHCIGLFCSVLLQCAVNITPLVGLTLQQITIATQQQQNESRNKTRSNSKSGQQHNHAANTDDKNTKVLSALDRLAQKTTSQMGAKPSHALFPNLLSLDVLTGNSHQFNRDTLLYDNSDHFNNYFLLYQQYRYQYACQTHPTPFHPPIRPFTGNFPLPPQQSHQPFILNILDHIFPPQSIPAFVPHVLPYGVLALKDRSDKNSANDEDSTMNDQFIFHRLTDVLSDLVPFSLNYTSNNHEQQTHLLSILQYVIASTTRLLRPCYDLITEQYTKPQKAPSGSKSTSPTPAPLLINHTHALYIQSNTPQQSFVDRFQQTTLLIPHPQSSAVPTKQSVQHTQHVAVTNHNTAFCLPFALLNDLTASSHHKTHAQQSNQPQQSKKPHTPQSQTEPDSIPNPLSTFLPNQRPLAEHQRTQLPLLPPHILAPQFIFHQFEQLAFLFRMVDQKYTFAQLISDLQQQLECKSPLVNTNAASGTNNTQHTPRLIFSCFEIVTIVKTLYQDSKRREDCITQICHLYYDHYTDQFQNDRFHSPTTRELASNSTHHQRHREQPQHEHELNSKTVSTPSTNPSTWLRPQQHPIDEPLQPKPQPTAAATFTEEQKEEEFDWGW